MTYVKRQFNFATDIFDFWARHHPEARALWWVDQTSGEEEIFTFSAMAALSRRAANLFRSAGVRKGDPVLIVLPRVPHWWIAMLGLIRLGAVPVPGTPLLTEGELAYRVEAAEIRTVIAGCESAGKLAGFAGTRFLSGGCESGWIDFAADLAKASPDFAAEPTLWDDAGILYFTSATTGLPKMVLHTQASYGLGHRLTGKLWLDLRAGDVHWNISDVGWAKAGWSSFYGPWNMGACIFAMDTPRFDAAKTLEALQYFPVTTWCAPPTALRMMIRENLSRINIPHLRHAVTAGEPLNPEVFNQWHAGTGVPLYEGYGQTESVVLAGNFRSLGHPLQPGSMGVANPAFDLVLLDEAEREAPDGTEGELAIRIAPKRPLGLFREYWRNPEATAAQFRGDWYFTGDRAIRDEDGFFWFVGRGDDVIKSSGYRIGPFEVESTLLEHPAVLDVAVVGKPDAVRGQLVKAYVVLRDPSAARPELRTELQAHCKRISAPYKYPREIEFVETLPKTASGKTRRVELRARDQA